MTSAIDEGYVCIVDVQSPYIVQGQKTSSSKNMFGYSESEMLGESILKLLGPKSDLPRLRDAIENSFMLTSKRIHFVFYGRGGEEKCLVSCESSCQKKCLISISLSEALDFHEALTDCLKDCMYSQTLILSEGPFTIQLANELFYTTFKRHRHHVLGRPLHSIVHDKSNSWPSVLEHALQGHAVHWTGEPPSPNEEPFSATVFPVLDPHGARIRLLLVRFSSFFPVLPLFGPEPDSEPPFADAPAGGQPGPSAPPASESRSSSAAAVWHQRPGIAGLRPTPAGAAATTAAVPRSAMADPCHTVFPRHRGGGGGGGGGGGRPEAGPSVITPVLLQSLHPLSLKEAARAAGVSVTSFKRACRRLGLPRWAYRRRPR